MHGKLTEYKAHYAATLKLGIPLLVGQLGVIVLGFADTLMVGRYGTRSLGAAAFVNNLYNLIIIAFLGFSYGLTPMVSAYCAQKRYVRAGYTLKNALVANGLFCVLIMAIMGVLYFFLDRLGQPSELLPLIRPYYLIVWLSMPFVVLFNVFRQLSDGIGRTTVSMWIILWGNLLNIFLNGLLIYGWGPFPEWGLLGAGVATLLSRIVMGVAIVGLIFRSPKYLSYKRGFLSGHPQRKEVESVTRNSLPVACQMGMETAAFSLSAVMVGWIGTVELAAYQVMITISTLGYLFYYSIGAAMAIRVAGFVGVNNWDEVRRSAFAACHLLVGMMLVADFVFTVFGHSLIGLFTTDASVRHCAGILLIPLVFYQLGDAMQIGFANAVRGTAQVTVLMLYAFVSYILVCLPVGYLFGFVFHWGITGIFFAFSVGLFLAAILYSSRFLQIVRRHRS